MEKITGFHLDKDNQWIAGLACDHIQHVKHNPPWQQPEWVLSESGRNDFIEFQSEYKSFKDKHELQ